MFGILDPCSFRREGADGIERLEMASLAPVVEGAVSNGADQRGPEVPRLPLGTPHPDFDEDLLDDVLGDGVGSDDAPGDVAEDGAIREVDITERQFVAVADTRDELGVGGRVFAGGIMRASERPPRFPFGRIEAIWRE